MYITETTDNVMNLIGGIEKQNDVSKLKFLIYIFGLLNNDQINDKNEANPNLSEDDIEIFNLEKLGLSPNAGTILLQYFAILYNNITKTKDAYENNGNIFGIDYTDEEKKLNSQFEKLDFNEKLDAFSEIIIRYDNETFFNKKIIMMTFSSELSGYDLARVINSLKKK